VLPALSLLPVLACSQPVRSPSQSLLMEKIAPQAASPSLAALPPKGTSQLPKETSQWMVPASWLAPLEVATARSPPTIPFVAVPQEGARVRRRALKRQMAEDYLFFENTR